jgi:hypothetical protein
MMQYQWDIPPVTLVSSQPSQEEKVPSVRELFIGIAMGLLIGVCFSLIIIGIQKLAIPAPITLSVASNEQGASLTHSGPSTPVVSISDTSEGEPVSS